VLKAGTENEKHEYAKKSIRHFGSQQESERETSS
jgi:hypothetical protein